MLFRSGSREDVLLPSKAVVWKSRVATAAGARSGFEVDGDGCVARDVDGVEDGKERVEEEVASDHFACRLASIPLTKLRQFLPFTGTCIASCALLS